MSYSYEAERPKIFTEDGQVMFLSIRDRANKLIETSGAFTCGRVIQSICGDTWSMLACIDRLVELGELREVTDPLKVRGQDRVFIRK